MRSTEALCKCEHNFTCGYCLRTKTPGTFLPWTIRTMSEVIADDMRRIRKEREKAITFINKQGNPSEYYREYQEKDSDLQHTTMSHHDH